MISSKRHNNTVPENVSSFQHSLDATQKLHLSRPGLPVSTRLAPRAPRVSRSRLRVVGGRCTASAGINGSAGSGSLRSDGGRRSDRCSRSDRGSRSSRVGRSTANARSRGAERSEELPSRLRCKRVVSAERSADVATVPCDERHGLGATLEIGADGFAAAGGGLANLLGLAAVVGNESIGKFDATADGQHVVANTVNAEVGDRVLATLAATDQTTSNRRDGAELASARAGNGVGHAATIGEAGGEARGLVDTEGAFDLLDDGVDEGDVGTATVGPAVVDTVRGDEDGGALGESIKSVPGSDAVAVDYIVHGTTEPVEAEDQTVRVAQVVVLRDLQGVLATINGLDA